MFVIASYEGDRLPCLRQWALTYRKRFLDSPGKYLRTYTQFSSSGKRRFLVNGVHCLCGRKEQLWYRVIVVWLIVMTIASAFNTGSWWSVLVIWHTFLLTAIICTVERKRNG